MFKDEDEDDDVDDTDDEHDDDDDDDDDVDDVDVDVEVSSWLERSLEKAKHLLVLQVSKNTIVNTFDAIFF